MSKQQQQTQIQKSDSSASNTDSASSSGMPAVTEQHKELATSATQEFEKANYSQSVSYMAKLHRQRGVDPKVVHNYAVAAFYHSNQCAVEELKNGLNAACQMAKSGEDPLDGIEDVENAVLYFNQAVLNFYLKQYRAALGVLDRGFQYIEPPDEALAQNVLLLWTELHLCVGQPDKALRVLGYLEKGTSNGKSGGQGSGTPERGEQGKEGSSGTSEGNDAIKAKICLFKTRCLAMMKSLKSCKREIKTLVSSPGLAGTAVQYVRAYFEYLRGNSKKAQKILTSAPTTGIPSAGQSLQLMFHNNMACIHLQMRRPHTGAHHLQRAWQENEKAMKEVKATSKGKPIQYVAISRHYELLYNMGIQALHCCKPSQAFDCLVVASQVYQVNPRLWLRLAECCVMHHRESNDDDSKLEKRQQVIQGSVGSGYHRKLIVGPGTGQNKTSNNPAAAVPALSMEFASMCLSNALNLLPPDPLDVEITPVEDNDTTKAAAEPALVPAPPASPMRPTEVANLRCSILAASAYVALCLNDFRVALKHAQNLLRQPRLSGAQRYVGNMYMAEALVATERIADAIGHLNPDALTAADVSTVPPEGKADPEKIDKNDKGERDASDSAEDKGALVAWIPRDVQKAKAFMQHNLAVCHATRTEYDKANKFLTEGSQNNGTPLPAQMYYLKLYLDLMEGRRQVAQAVIKDHFGHVTPNRPQSL
ncbi:CCR4-NOT transcription complex subunit 10-like isoform X2 [Littorina saxatilis]|uniref:CCR4-NOT transcription complex subunit 10-like isoform X2 n=1 Tax=Littorina saxatilis TaxID=31220 RepID=UPI0038B528B1